VRRFSPAAPARLPPTPPGRTITRAGSIRLQERRDARHDGSHLTRREQARLNHEETGVRHHIPA
jgi:hypothetical protein